MLITLTNTIAVIANCWRLAESQLQQKVQRFTPNVNEEYITRDFHGQFARSLELASKQKKIEAAFRDDMRIAFSAAYQIYPDDLDCLADGLIASSQLHSRQIETDTGGDLGLIVSTPIISVLPDEGYDVQYVNSGLLCQAKLLSKDGTWGQLTETQNKVLPKSLSYAALLLYSYQDGMRRALAQFEWQLCSKASTIRTVKKWLKSGRFPNKISSTEILRQLAAGNIGTHDEQILGTIIAPPGATVLEIRVHWIDGKPPEFPVRVYESTTQTVQQHIS